MIPHSTPQSVFPAEGFHGPNDVSFGFFTTTYRTRTLQKWDYRTGLDRLEIKVLLERAGTRNYFLTALAVTWNFIMRNYCKTVANVVHPTKSVQIQRLRK